MSVEEQSKAPAVSVPVDLVHLTRIGRRPSLPDYLVQLWDRRSFILFDAQARVQGSSEKNVLGSAWLVLTPLMTGMSFYLIFGLLLNTSKGIENFIGYLIIGVFTFQMTTRSVLGGAKSLTGNTAMIRAFQFPRASLPLALNVREFLANIPVILVMLLLIIAIAPAEEISWRWFLILPALGLQFLLNLGLGMLLARPVLRIPDVGKLLSFVMQLWMYTSAVFFSEDRFDNVPILKDIMNANPLFLLIKIMRDSVLYDTTPSWRSWAIVSLWALGALIVGLVVFWRGEESYGRA